MYPPVGSTFEGRRSVSAAAAYRRTIDTLDDFRYQKPRLDVGLDVHKEGPAVGKFRGAAHTGDQLDSFLSDYVSGVAKPVGIPGGRGQAGRATELDMRRTPNSILARYAMQPVVGAR